MRKICLIKNSFSSPLCRLYFYQRVENLEDEEPFVSVYFNEQDPFPFGTLPMRTIEVVRQEDAVFIRGLPHLKTQGA